MGHGGVKGNTTMTRRERMYAQIEAHGRRLLRVWPDARPTDPVKLCRALLRVERAARRDAARWCNGDIDEAEYWRREGQHLTKARAILHDVHRLLSINSDPRGYALVVIANGLDLPTNMGGDGVVCPTFDGTED